MINDLLCWVKLTLPTEMYNQLVKRITELQEAEKYSHKNVMESHRQTIMGTIEDSLFTYIRTLP